MQKVEAVFERLLWHSRLLVLLAVVASLVTAVVLFLLVTIDVFHLAQQSVQYANIDLTNAMRDELREAAFGQIVDIIDGYLLGGIMLIFALGLYELFIGKINDAENTEFATRLLLIRNLDDLKNRLAKVVLLMLIVKFFQYALQLPFKSALDLLYLGLGIALIGLALYLSNAKEH